MPIRAFSSVYWCTIHFRAYILHVYIYTSIHIHLHIYLIIFYLYFRWNSSKAQKKRKYSHSLIKSTPLKIFTNGNGTMAIVILPVSQIAVLVWNKNQKKKRKQTTRTYQWMRIQMVIFCVLSFDCLFVRLMVLVLSLLLLLIHSMRVIAAHTFTLCIFIWCYFRLLRFCHFDDIHPHWMELAFNCEFWCAHPFCMHTHTLTRGGLSNVFLGRNVKGALKTIFGSSMLPVLCGLYI